MTFGASCSPSTTQYIMNVNARRFKDQYPTAADVIHNHHQINTKSSSRTASTNKEGSPIIMMIFDLLGLISHVLMYFKILLHDIWRTGIEWDEPLKGNLLDKWLNWLTVLPLLEEVQIPRCYRSETSADCNNTIQLYTFVDASENGFAAAVFLRYEEHDVVECCLVGAKTRVAPFCIIQEKSGLHPFILIPKLKRNSVLIYYYISASKNQ
uniref:Reverse transcriptase/retrotransposon-derived protein RNase H-like domain-containing protein n=1 Tax=Anopheles christyi TaxID=43041 RepID=A0A182K2Z1_9DIPT